MKKNISYLWMMFVGLAVIASACSKEKNYGSADEWVNDLKMGLKSVSVEELKQKVDDFEMIYVLDVREPMEHYHGLIPGSINLPGGLVIFNMAVDGFWEAEMTYPPQKSDEIIVYCKKGNRSVIAADALKRLGYENVSYLEGGWKKWELTYPLEYEEKLDMLGGHEEKEEVGGC
jgi:rhodanese-related sulfurtransferase